MRHILPILALALAGCATGFATRPYHAATDSGELPGILYYPPRLTRVTYTYTVLTGQDGSLQGSTAEGSCRAVVQKEELQVLPDYAHPHVFLNTSSPLSTGKVGVSLSQGMITSVNVENTPPVAGLATPTGTIVSTAITTLSAMPGKADSTPQALPACNAGPAITAITAL